jgi:outer membrane lipoprotein-sorting protein
MELGTLLELLYSARDRSQTVRAIIRRVHRQARELELLRARGLYRDPPPIPAEEGSWGAPSNVIETTTRVWAARPHWFRWESTFGGGIAERTSIGVKEGELFWQTFGDGEVHTNEQRPMGGTMTTDEERLLDPSALLGIYRFETGSPTVLLGRPSIEVTARRRVGVHGHEFGPLSDELELVVDEERGVLLRLAVIVEGEEISLSEVVEVAFDEPISAELFRPLR